MLRLWSRPHPSRPGLFTVSIEGKTLCISRQPMADGCRMLIKFGFPPSMLATLRHEGADSDSFEPETLEAWSKRSFVESPTGVRAVPYVAFSQARVGRTDDSPQNTQEHSPDPESSEKGD